MVVLAFLTLLSAPPAPGKLVDAGGYRVHLYCTGQGNPTVMIVGAGFSFDWGLVQPEASKFTRVCTYDPAGMAWSDPAPSAPTCSQKVKEIHTLVKNAGIPGPHVLVGLSLGAVVARLYASQYPREVAGMVIVDHAFLNPNTSEPAVEPQTPIVVNLEDDPNYARLPERNREMRRWAVSLNPARPTLESAEACVAEADAAAGKFPSNLPLFVVSTASDSPNYLRLQTELLALSSQSRQLIAEKSYHPVHIDQPEVIVDAIQEVVAAVRKHSGAKRN